MKDPQVSTLGGLDVDGRWVESKPLYPPIVARKTEKPYAGGDDLGGNYAARPVTDGEVMMLHSEKTADGRPVVGFANLKPEYQSYAREAIATALQRAGRPELQGEVEHRACLAGETDVLVSCDLTTRLGAMFPLEAAVVLTVERIDGAIEAARKRRQQEEEDRALVAAYQKRKAEQEAQRAAELERTAEWRALPLRAREAFHAAHKFGANTVERRALCALAESIIEAGSRADAERSDPLAGLPMPEGFTR